MLSPCLSMLALCSVSSIWSVLNNSAANKGCWIHTFCLVVLTRMTGTLLAFVVATHLLITMTIDLNLIQPHIELNDRVPDCGRLMYSCADDPDKHTYKKAKPEASKTEVTQWKNQDVQKENKQQKCQTPSSIVFNNKNCQAEKSVNMQPKKPKKDMQSNGSAMLIQYKMLKKWEDDKNCQINGKPMKSKVCADKKCQATKYYKERDKNYQTNVLQLVKPPIDVQFFILDCYSLFFIFFSWIPWLFLNSLIQIHINSIWC